MNTEKQGLVAKFLSGMRFISRVLTESSLFDTYSAVTKFIHSSGRILRSNQNFSLVPCAFQGFTSVATVLVSQGLYIVASGV